MSNHHSAVLFISHNAKCTLKLQAAASNKANDRRWNGALSQSSFARRHERSILQFDDAAEAALEQSRVVGDRTAAGRAVRSEPEAGLDDPPAAVVRRRVVGHPAAAPVQRGRHRADDFVAA